jgi:hypothetical protein
MGAILSFYLGWSSMTPGSNESAVLAAAMSAFKYGIILYAVESVLILFKKINPEIPKINIVLAGMIILLICPFFGYLGATLAIMK